MIRPVLKALAIVVALGAPASIGMSATADAQVMTVRDDGRNWKRHDRNRNHWKHHDRRHARDWKHHDRRHWRGHDRNRHGWWGHSYRQPAWRVCYDRWSGRSYRCR